MTGTGIHRVRLSVDFEEPDRTTCRFLSPQQPADEVSAIGQIDAADEAILADYRSDLESLFEEALRPDREGCPDIMRSVSSPRRP